MGWTLHDILYVRLKVGSDEVRHLTSELAQWLHGASVNRSYAAVNYMWERCVVGNESTLYYWAEQRFRQQVHSEWAGLEEEEARFAEMLAELHAQCGATARRSRGGHPGMNSSSADDGDCARYAEDNLGWNDRHRQLQ